MQRTVRNAITFPVDTRLNYATPVAGAPPAEPPPPPLPSDPHAAMAAIIEALGLPPNTPLDMVDEAFGALATAIQASAPDGVPATVEEMHTLAAKHKLSRDFVRACFASKDFKRSDLDRYVAQQRRLGRL